MSFIEMEQTISCQQIEIEDLKAANAALELEVVRLREALEFLNARIVTMDLGGVVERALSTPFTPTALNELIEKVERLTIERDDFEEGTDDYQIQGFIVLWEQVKSDIHRLKMNLPEGFLQRRVICTNYKVLRNIIGQREGHRLKLWQTFIDEVLAQAEHPEYLK